MYYRLFHSTTAKIISAFRSLVSFYNPMKFIFYLVLVLIENDAPFLQSHIPWSLVITETVGRWDSYPVVFLTPLHYLIPIPTGHKYPWGTTGVTYSVLIYQHSLLPRTPPRSDLARQLRSLFFLPLPPFLQARSLLVLARPAPAYLLFAPLLEEAPCSALAPGFMFSIIFSFGHITI